MRTPKAASAALSQSGFTKKAIETASVADMRTMAQILVR